MKNKGIKLFLGCIIATLTASIAAYFTGTKFLEIALLNDDRTVTYYPTDTTFQDIYVTMPSGERHHAIYLRNDTARGRTAIVVHGYKDNCRKFADIAMIYYRQLGYNILLPDLHAHGLSEGRDIQMGWKDRLDVKCWTHVADTLFASKGGERTRMVIHGVSMGAATTMCLSGESNLPDYIRCFVEDCGYTSVREQFAWQLKEQYGLPAFPIIDICSRMCKRGGTDGIYGWSFDEASPLAQVSKCKRPMLFIHGDADTYVPFHMMQKLYDAKPQPKEMWVARGTAHARAYKDHPEAYAGKIKEFVERHIGR